MATLEVDSLNFGYGKDPVLTDVTLDFPAGSVTGILGPNGSGKSTLLQLLMGYLKPGAGKVRLEGQSIHDLSAKVLAQKMAWMGPQLEAGGRLLVRDILSMVTYPFEGPFSFRSAMPEGSEAVIAAFGLASFLQRPFFSLSSGEQQRVRLAQVLLRRPKVLLLDEPFSHVDPAGQFRMLQLLVAPCRQAGTTVLMVSHDVLMSQALCERQVLLKAGRVLAAGETATVLTVPAAEALYDCELPGYVKRELMLGQAVC